MLADMSKLKWALISAGFLAVLYLAAHVALSEDVTTEAGTFWYYARIPSIVRNAPTPGASGPPTYYSTTGDGFKLPASGMRFKPADPGDARAELVQYFLQNGFTPHASGTLTRRNQYVAFAYVPDSGLLEVLITTNFYVDDVAAEFDQYGSGKQPAQLELAPDGASPRR